MTGLVCEWCGGQRRPTQKSACSARCRGGQWRWLNDVRRAGGMPPEAPPWPDSPLHGRMGEEARSNSAPVVSEPEPGPRSGANARSGCQVSFSKAVDVLAQALQEAYGEPDGWSACKRAAERLMADALSPKQRARLEAPRVSGRSVFDVLRDCRFAFGDEDQLQEAIATALRTAGFTVEREVRLTARDRIDLLAGRVGIEVKIAGSTSRVVSQLRRYATHPLVDELVLVTRCARHTAPARLNGKPVHVVNLAGSGL